MAVRAMPGGTPSMMRWRKRVRLDLNERLVKLTEDFWLSSKQTIHA
jgi:hypothetical protein